MIRYVNTETEKGVFHLFPKRYWLVILTYVMMFVFTAMIPLVLHFGYQVDAFKATIYTNIVLFIIAAAIVLFIMKQDLREERLSNPISGGKILGWTVLGVFLAWTAQIIAVTIETQLLGIDLGSENTEIIVELTRLNPIFLLILALVGSILEELIVRDVLFGSLRKKMHVIWAALISSIIFAIAHAELLHILIYTSMGLVFTFLYVKTKRIIVPIIVHMTLNTITVLGQLLIDPNELERMQQELLLIFFGG